MRAIDSPEVALPHPPARILGVRQVAAVGTEALQQFEVSTTEIGRLANSDVSPAPTVRSARRKVPCPTALNRLRAKAYHRGAAYVARAEKRRGRCRNSLLVRLA